MLKIQYVLPFPTLETAQFPSPENPLVRSRRRRLRLFLVGSQADTQSAIDSLQVLGYAEQFEWSRVIAIPKSGLVIQPDPDDVLRYLQRYRQLS